MLIHTGRNQGGVHGAYVAKGIRIPNKVLESVFKPERELTVLWFIFNTSEMTVRPTLE